MHLDDELQRKVLLHYLGLDVHSPSSTITIDVREKDGMQRPKIEYDLASNWAHVHESSKDLFMEYQIARRYFWCLAFWEKTLKSNYSASKGADPDQNSDGRYYETRLAAPVLKTFLGTVYERHIDNRRIFSEIGAQTYCYGVKAEDNIVNNRTWAYTMKRIIEQCSGVDCFVRHVSDSPFEERNWGCLYIFPFPFTIVWAADGSKSDPLVFCLSEKGTPDAETLMKRQHQTHMFQDIDSDSMGDHETRIKIHADMLAKIVQWNTNDSVVMEQKQLRNQLRALHGYRLSLRSTKALRFQGSQRMFVVDDLYRTKLSAFHATDMLQSANSYCKELYDYPILTLSKYFKHKSLHFIPGLHVYLDSSSSGVLGRCIACFTSTRDDDGKRRSFTDDKLRRDIFETSAKSKSRLIDFYSEQVGERNNDLSDLRRKLAFELHSRSSVILPYSFLTDCIFNPDITYDEFIDSKILYDTQATFDGELRAALELQSFLRERSPAEFTWFMFWFSFYNEQRHNSWMDLKSEAFTTQQHAALRRIRSLVDVKKNIFIGRNFDLMSSKPSDLKSFVQHQLQDFKDDDTFRSFFGALKEDRLQDLYDCIHILQRDYGDWEAARQVALRSNPTLSCRDLIDYPELDTVRQFQEDHTSTRMRPQAAQVERNVRAIPQRIAAQTTVAVPTPTEVQPIAEIAKPQARHFQPIPMLLSDDSDDEIVFDMDVFLPKAKMKAAQSNDVQSPRQKLAKRETNLLFSDGNRGKCSRYRCGFY